MAIVSRLTLDEKAFTDLVRGKPVVLYLGSENEIHIRLAKIGWDRMFFHIERAMRDAGEGDLV